MYCLYIYIYRMSNEFIEMDISAIKSKYVNNGKKRIQLVRYNSLFIQQTWSMSTKPYNP